MSGKWFEEEVNWIRPISHKMFRCFKGLLLDRKEEEVYNKLWRDWGVWRNDGDILILASQVLEESLGDR